MHEELGRHDIEPLAHVFSDAHHRLAALRRGASGVLGFVAVNDAAQVLGQLLAARLALGRRLWLWRWHMALQDLQLGLQVRLVLGQDVLKHLALLGVHGLGAGTELPGLQARELEGDALDLGVLELDLAIAPGNVLILGEQLFDLAPVGCSS